MKHQKICEEQVFCDRVHFSDYSLWDKLNVGQVYEKIASRDTPRCGPAYEGYKPSDTYRLVWLSYYEVGNKCRTEDLVAFETEPPDRFIFSLNGEIVEVKSDEPPGHHYCDQEECHRHPQ